MWVSLLNVLWTLFMNTHQISACVFVQPSLMKIHQASLLDAEWTKFVNTVNMCFTLMK
jgi:hypothetical protein